MNSSKVTLLTTKPKRKVDYKIVLLGESSVGKSSILERLQNNSFNDNKSSTIGAAFISKKIVTTSNDLINLQIWDTAGQERFHNLTPLYYRNSNVSIIVFDLNNLESFKKAEYWINELNNYINDEADGQNMEIVLVGNKLDLLENGDCSFEDEVNKFIAKNSKIIKYFKTSAKENTQIFELFDFIINNINDNLFVDIDDNNDNSKRGLIDLSFKNNSLNSSNCQC